MSRDIHTVKRRILTECLDDTCTLFTNYLLRIAKILPREFLQYSIVNDVCTSCEYHRYVCLHYKKAKSISVSRFVKPVKVFENGLHRLTFSLVWLTASLCKQSLLPLKINKSTIQFFPLMKLREMAPAVPKSDLKPNFASDTTLLSTAQRFWRLFMKRVNKFSKKLTRLINETFV